MLCCEGKGSRTYIGPADDVEGFGAPGWGTNKLVRWATDVSPLNSDSDGRGIRAVGEKAEADGGGGRSGGEGEDGSEG